MYLSAVLTTISSDFGSAARQAAALGFSHIDVDARAERPETDLEVLADTGLIVSCATLAKGLPDDLTLDHASVQNRRRALELLKRQVIDAANLGATSCSLRSGNDSSDPGLARFAETCALVADFAGQRMVRLCIEPISGRALPTVTALLDWLDQVSHPNLALLLDVGLCLKAREDPGRMIARAFDRLGHVHFSYHDGVNDEHRPLLKGRLSREEIQKIVMALDTSCYAGGLALELSHETPDLLETLREQKALLERMIEFKA